MDELKYFRKKIGKTQKQMAIELKISQSFYEKIESGKKKPSRKFLEKLKKKYPFLDINIFLE